MLVEYLRQLVKERPQSFGVGFLGNRPAQFTHTDNESGFHFSPEWRVE